MDLVTWLGSATLLIEVAGLRLLTDPVLDSAGTEWALNPRLPQPSLRYRSLSGPALDADALGPLDAVLLSHDQHRDNFDLAGRRVAARATCILTTELGASRLAARGLAQARGLAPGQHVELHGPCGTVRITAMPAYHARAGARWLAGPVIGFLIEALGRRHYVSGDTVWFDGLREMARQRPIDTLFVHLGAARFGRGLLRRCAHWSFTAEESARLSQVVQPRRIVPIHYEGWSHFTEGLAEIEIAYRQANMADRLVVLPRGGALNWA